MEIFPKIKVLIGFVAVMLLSCDKDDNQNKPPISASKLSDCFRSAQWDNQKVKDALIGTWEWTYTVCYWTQENGGEYVTEEEVEIEFRADSTLEIREHGVITQTSVWQVVDHGDENFMLYVDPEVPQADGFIQLCNNWVEFSLIIVDGCSNIFKRK